MPNEDESAEKEKSHQEVVNNYDWLSEKIHKPGPPKPPEQEEHASRQPATSEPSPVKECRSRKATGPRTRLGKEKSKFNALKHGLFSKAILLKDESKASYQILFNELMEDLQPQGKLETILVEILVTTLWRRRRCLQFETAEISKANFLRVDFVTSLSAQHLDYPQHQGPSAKLPDGTNDLAVVREAIKMLETMQICLTTKGIGDKESRKFIDGAIGRDQKDFVQDRIRRMCLEVARLTAQFVAGKEIKNDEELKKNMVEAIDAEINRLKELNDLMVRTQSKKVEYDIAAARIPSQLAADLLIPYETRLSREFDKTLSQLERMQRMRKGQLVLPPIKVDVST